MRTPRCCRPSRLTSSRCARTDVAVASLAAEAASNFPVALHHVARENSAHCADAADDEPEHRPLKCATTIAGLLGFLPAAGFRQEPDALARVTLEIPDDCALRRLRVVTRR